jgi:hypothetical protein
MSAPSRAKLTPLERRLVAAIARTHGMTTAYVPMDRIMCALAWDGDPVPRQTGIVLQLEGLTRRGILEQRGDAWHWGRLTS